MRSTRSVVIGAVCALVAAAAFAVAVAASSSGVAWPGLSAIPAPPTVDNVCLPRNRIIKAKNKIDPTNPPTSSYKAVCTLYVTNTAGATFNEQSALAATLISSGVCGTVALYVATGVVLNTPGSSLKYYQLTSSNTQLWLDSSAGIQGWTDLSAWEPSTNALVRIGSLSSSAWLERVGICGNGNGMNSGGYIDGNAQLSSGSQVTGFYNTDSDKCGDNFPWPGSSQTGAPKLVTVSNVNTFSVNSVQLLNSPHFTLYMSHVQNVYISQLNIALPNFGASVVSGCNIDGIDLTYAYGVTIQRSNLQTGDDNIAAKWMNANVAVSDVNAYTGHGFTAGQQSGGSINGGSDPICNTAVSFTRVSGVTQRQTVSLKANPYRNYDLSGITYNDVCALGAAYPINARTYDSGKKDGNGQTATIFVAITDLQVLNGQSGSTATCKDRVSYATGGTGTLSMDNSPIKAYVQDAANKWPRDSEFQCDLDGDGVNPDNKDLTITCQALFAGTFTYTAPGSLRCNENVSSGDSNSRYCSSNTYGNPPLGSKCSKLASPSKCAISTTPRCTTGWDPVLATPLKPAGFDPANGSANAKEDL